MTEQPMIQSFSGTHPYSEEHVRFAIELDWFGGLLAEEEVREAAVRHSRRVTDALDRSVCPRCSGALDPDYNAGSRVTSCRCIPICPSCGTDEAFQNALGKPYSGVWRWPVSKSWITRRRNQVMSKATVTTGTVSGGSIITEKGVTRLKLRPHPGGWAEFGYDDQPKHEEEKS